MRSARRRPARAAALASRAKSCSSAVPGAKAVNSTASRSTAPTGGACSSRVRSGAAMPVGGRVLERRFDQPRRAVLELGSDAHYLHPPADATWMLECALEQLVQRMREQLALGDRREERDRGGDRLGCRPAYDALDRRPRREPPQA